MWNKILTDEEIEEREIEIKKLIDYFTPLLPDIDKDLLRKRISVGYVVGEGVGTLTSIKVWEGILLHKGLGRMLTIFNDWDDYQKYNGDYKEKAVAMGWLEHR